MARVLTFASSSALQLRDTSEELQLHLPLNNLRDQKLQHAFERHRASRRRYLHLLPSSLGGVLQGKLLTGSERRCCSRSCLVDRHHLRLNFRIPLKLRGYVTSTVQLRRRKVDRTRRSDRFAQSSVFPGHHRRADRHQLIPRIGYTASDFVERFR